MEFPNFLVAGSLSRVVLFRFPVSMARGQLTQVIYDTHRDDDDDRYELIISCGSIFALPLSLEVSKIFRNRLLSRPLHRLSFVDESRNQHTTQGKKSPPEKKLHTKKGERTEAKKTKKCHKNTLQSPDDDDDENIRTGRNFTHRSND